METQTATNIGIILALTLPVLIPLQLALLFMLRLKHQQIRRDTQRFINLRKLARLRR